MRGGSSRWLTALAVVAFALPAYAVEPGAEAPGKAKGAERRATPERHKPEELLVKLREGVTDLQAEAILGAHGAGQGRKFKLPRQARAGAAIERWRHLRVPPGRDLERLALELRMNPAIERVEPNFELRAQFTPDDPRFPEQWPLHNIGQTGGAADADIDAIEAWDVANGGETLVAVIDTGVDATHPELAGNMWVNPGEIPGNGIDDDGNGYVDDVHGYDFANYDADPSDDHGHGTHVAGTIAAAGNNAAGITGMAWRAKIMSVKFLGADGRGWISDAVNAVLYATDMGARVLNNSWGGGGYSQALRDAIAAADEAGSLFVAAAGNQTSDNDAYPFYPAAYDVPNVVAVAASDKFDSPAWFTNVGNRSVLLAAPGQDVLSSVPAAGNECCTDPSGYRLLSGTSMAAPHVSGAAALLLAQDPSRSAANLVPLLEQTVDPRAAGVRTRSGGRLNVNSALRCDTGVLGLFVRTPDHGYVAFVGEPFQIRAQVHACGYPVTGASVTVAFMNGDAPVTLYDDGAHGDGAADDGIYAGTWVPENMASQVTLQVTASDTARGTATLHRSGLVRKRITYRVAPATYSWIDASGGTTPTLNWFGSATLQLPFSFEFYGQLYSTVFLYKNGFLSVFGPGGDYYWPTRLPDPETIDGVIAAYWTGPHRFTWGPDTRIFVLSDGTAPRRRVTVSWNNLRDNITNEPYAFQATLHEGSNEIVVQYRQIPDLGAGASVGVENQDGTEGTQYSGFTAALAESSALRFVPGPFNRAPVANPGGPYTTVPGLAVAFDGTRSTDAENDALTYRWNFGDGATATGPNPPHAYAAKGTYTATLIVNDGIHDSPPVTTSVTVQNRPPVASFTAPATGRRGYAVNLDATASHDPDGDAIFAYRWSFGDGYSTELRGMPTVQYIYSQLGTYTVTLVVNDSQADSAPVSATVAIVNVPPVANAGPDATVASRSTVFLSSSSSDVDGQIVQYQWRQVAGPAVTLANASTSVATFTAPNAKAGSAIVLEFELTVRDNDGAQASDRKIVTVVK